MKTLMKIYEDDFLFEEVYNLVNIDTNMDNWERHDSQHGYEHARPLLDKKTNRHVGWIVFEQSYNADTCEINEETFITIEGDVLPDW